MLVIWKRAPLQLADNQLGFTLAEACMSMGIGAMLILALCQFSISSARGTNARNMTTEFEQLSARINAAIGTESSCTAMLTQPASATVLITSPVTPLLHGISMAGAGNTPITVIPPVGFTYPSGLMISKVQYDSYSTCTGSTCVPAPIAAAGQPAYTLNNMNEYILNLTVEADMTSPQPKSTSSLVPAPVKNYSGNTHFSKSFQVAVWLPVAAASSAAADIQQCATAKDMGVQNSVTGPVGAGGTSCTGPLPSACPTGTSARCCANTTANNPFWYCAGTNGSQGWTCPSS